MKEAVGSFRVVEDVWEVLYVTFIFQSSEGRDYVCGFQCFYFVLLQKIF